MTNPEQFTEHTNAGPRDASAPEHNQDGTPVTPQPYHPNTPAGVEGDAYVQGGAEYEALQRAEDPPLEATTRPDDERQYEA